MILTLTPNPALDITWTVDHLALGEVHRAPRGIARAGGKGINVARVLHDTGHEVIAVAPGPGGDEFAAELAESGIPHQVVPVDGAMRRSLSLVDASRGDATVVNETGAGLTPAECELLIEQATETAHHASVIAICGSLPAGVTPAVLADWVRLLQRSAAPVVVDTSGDGLIAAAAAGAWALKPNREELLTATGLDDPVAAARHLLDLGTRLVVVSLGADGLLVVCAADPAGHLHARLPRPLSGNPTGAGDAAVAALCSALATDGRLHSWTDSAVQGRAQLARTMTAWSASAVLAPLAGSLGGDVDELMAEVVVTQVAEPS